MKKVKTVDAVGCILFHDVTKIEKDKFKGVLFKKGHIIREEDIEKLLDIGKRNLYVVDDNEDLVHENDAAEFIYNLCKNDYMKPTDIKEGKIEAIATEDSLLIVDVNTLLEVNMQDDIMIASKKTNILIKKGERVFGTRIIPLAIEKEKLDNLKDIVGDKKIFTLMPLKSKKIGLVITGSEVFTGRIDDKIGPTIIEKCSKFNVEFVHKGICDDNVDMITDNIKMAIEKGADLILCSGGMSVDPDDVTPTAIKNTGAEIISYGSPVLPGAMFLVSYYNDIPILGLPGCVMFCANTIFDIILPNVLAGYKIDKKFIASLGHGGLNVKTLME